MGTDDELDWQPKPVRPRVKPEANGIGDILVHTRNTPNNSYKGTIGPIVQPQGPEQPIVSNQKIDKTNMYHVTLNGDKRVVNGTSLDEIIRNIKQKYNLPNTQQIRINFWSDEYHEWLFLDSFPPDKTKLQVLVLDNNSEIKKPGFQLKNEEELNQIVRAEIQKYLEQPVNFAKHMNYTLKYYVESNKQDMLNHFEQSVHYINKRYNQNHSSPSKEVLHIQQQQQDIILTLHEETKQLQNENRKLKQQIEELRKDVESLDATYKLKPNNNNIKKKGRCSIM